MFPTTRAALTARNAVDGFRAVTASAIANADHARIAAAAALGVRQGDAVRVRR